MTVNDILSTEREINRLLLRINDLKRTDNFRRNLENGSDGMAIIHSLKETGAVRRASMDVTRALASLRKYS